MENKEQNYLVPLDYSLCDKFLTQIRYKFVDNLEELLYHIAKSSEVKRNSSPPKLAREKRDWNNPD